MYFPDKQNFLEKSASKRLVPVCRSIIADLDTPLSLFAKVATEEPHAFLFESMEGGEQWGRYSFIGLDPLVLFSSFGQKVHITWPARSHLNTKNLSASDPLAELKALLASLQVVTLPDLPKFYGGAVGFLGYDMVRFIERLPDRHLPSELPDSAFMVPGLVLIHDNKMHRLSIVCNVWIDEDQPATQLYDQACQKIEALVKQLAGPIPASCLEQTICKPHDFQANMEAAEFEQIVEQAHDYIMAGDIFQVVLSQRFHARSTIKNPFSLYRALRHVNPSPYLFYLRFADLLLIGSSPEVLARLEDGTVELRPIAGTRKRGQSPKEDAALEEELRSDPKEQAEHLMLVDLGRNDAGRVAEPGTVEVENMLSVERYSHVMHLVSSVQGRLRQGLDQFDVLRACFPAGTVSGAPKIRAMEIIDELENIRRGPYAGAVGYFGFSGNMNFCITIRTLILQGDDLWIQSGAGIVADSDPKKEYEETVNKAMALRKAVELAERGFFIP